MKKLKDENILDKVNQPEDLKPLNFNQLSILANQIRHELINVANDHPIHLSSNLGIVEISIGVLYSFDLNNDLIIYDTGHQCYTHKILTNRKQKFNLIKCDNGISGFQDPNESQYDHFSTGHSGNALSAAAGMQLNKQINNEYNKYTIVIIGDGALANGESLEALNNIVVDNERLIIVVNDNGMAISQSVGALAKLLSKIKLSKLFFGSERSVKKILAGKKPSSKIFEFIYNSYN